MQPGDYAAGSAEAARLGFEAAGRQLKLAPEEVARRMLEASGTAVGQLVGQVAHEHEIAQPVVMAVGGGAGGLGRHVAAMLGLECVVPPGAEVISSIGDALSLVRAARERTVVDPTAADVDALIAEVEIEAISAGAGPATLEVRVEYVGDRKALRAVATGSIGLEAARSPAAARRRVDRRDPRDRARVRRAASSASSGSRGEGPGRGVRPLRRRGGRSDRRSRRDERSGRRRAARRDRAAVEQRTKTVGPMRVSPSVWVVRPMRVTELASGDVVDASVALADTDEEVAIVVGRE